jgi:hypothetical protein
MFHSQKWQCWLVAGVMLVACFAPQVASAARRGTNIPFVITSQGPIRKSVYYAHLMSPAQLVAQRKLEDDYIEKVKKAQAAQQAKTQTTTPTRK